jgi:outer membrane protein TolC
MAGGRLKKNANRQGWPMSALGLGLALVWGVLLWPQVGQAALSLEQCLEKAVKISPEVKEARQDVEISKSKKDEAHANLFPTIDVIGLFGPTPKARGDQVWSPDPVTRLHGLTIFGRITAKIVQPIYTFGKIKNREEAAKSGVEVSQAGVVKKEGEVILKDKEAYYGLLLGRIGGDAIKEVQGYLDKARETLRHLLAINNKNVTEIDQYKLEAYSGEVEKYRNMTTKATALAHNALKTYVGVATNEPLDIQDQALPMNEPTLQPLSYYVTKSQELRPEFKQLKEGMRARKHLVDAAKADMYPSFFVAGYGSAAGAPDRTRIRNPFITDDYNHLYAGAAGGLKWEWDFGIKQAKVRGAKAELDKLNETQEYAQGAIPLQVEKSYLEVKETWGNVKAFQRAYTEARKWLVAAQSNFDMGVTPAKEVFDAIEKYALNRGEFLRALYDYNMAMAQLHNNIGEIRVK